MGGRVGWIFKRELVITQLYIHRSTHYALPKWVFLKAKSYLLNNSSSPIKGSVIVGHGNCRD